MPSLPKNRAHLHSRYREGLSPLAVVEDCLAAITEARDPGIFLHLLPGERIRALAAALPPFDHERFPLWGLPFAIKDNIDLAGTPTTAGCPAYARTPAVSATVVDRLIAAGAIPI